MIDRAPAWSLAVPAALVALAVAGFIITISRAPVVWFDEVIYASIARAVQLGRTTVVDGTTTISHVQFYGPAYFSLAAASFHLLGFSLETFRALGVVSTLVSAIAAATIVGTVGGSRQRQLWTAALVLLTPELGSAATMGRMDPVALAWSLLSLACYCRGLVTASRLAWYGVASGVFLGLCMLTTPRTFPFVAAFVGVAGALAIAHRDTSAIRAQAGWTVATLAIVATAWAVAGHGSVWQWLGLHASTVQRSTLNVALIPGVDRNWSAVSWHVVTSLAGAVGLVLVAAWGRRELRRPAYTFLLAVVVVNAAASIAVMNHTFVFAIYFAVGPLIAVVATMPPLARRRRAIAMALLGALVTIDVAVRTAKYIRVVATWDARDARPIERFVAAHIPAGSLALGPPPFYFYAVERTGSLYFDVTQSSLQSWSRMSGEPVWADRPGARRYLLWPDDSRLYQAPAELMCPGLRLVARYMPPPDSRRLLGPLASLPGILPDTYSPTSLYEVLPGCG